jgi:hypothetical protein
MTITQKLMAQRRTRDWQVSDDTRFARPYTQSTQIPTQDSRHRLDSKQIGRAWRRVFETVWRVGAKELGADDCTDYGVHLRCQWVRIGIEAETHEVVSRPTYSVEGKAKGNNNNIECLMRLKGKSYGIHAVRGGALAPVLPIVARTQTILTPNS